MFSAFRRLGAQKKVAPRSVRLCIESLEQREVPANFLVTNLNDAGLGSLRQAVIDANGVGTDDVIQFQAGLTGTITLTSGQLTVTDDVDIQGPGAAVISVSGNNASRIFNIDDGNAANIAVSIDGLTLTGGNGSGGGGGAIFTNEDLTITDSLLDGNTAAGSGGAVAALFGNSNSLTIRDTTISNNSASGGGGVSFYSQGNVDISNTTFSSNQATGGNGGGIQLEEGGTAIIDNVIATQNTATGTGGGIFIDDIVTTINATTISGNTANRGGGAYFYADVAITLSNSTVSGNTAPVRGGGIEVQFGQPVVIENSTITGNSTAGQGGGVFTGANNVTINNSTIALNTAATGGGGVLANGSTVSIANSILSGNTGNGGAADDVNRPGGTLNARFNLIQTAPTGGINGTNTGNIVGANPLLGALANNGGPTQTMLPGAGSPAINAGDPAFAPPPATDQRGLPRVAFGRLDIGAVEVGAAIVVPPPPPPPGGPGDDVSVEDKGIVQALYRKILGRETDPFGLDGYDARLADGESVESIAREIWESREHRELQVTQYFRQFLETTPADLSAEAARLSEVGEERYIAELLGSNEYRALYPNDAEWLYSVYVQVLGRAPDDGNAGYISRLAAGESRTDIAHEIVGSNEAELFYVTGLYPAYLERTGGPGEILSYQQGLADLEPGFKELSLEFLSSGEFYLLATT